MFISSSLKEIASILLKWILARALKMSSLAQRSGSTDYTKWMYSPKSQFIVFIIIIIVIIKLKFLMQTKDIQFQLGATVSKMFSRRKLFLKKF